MTKSGSLRPQPEEDLPDMTLEQLPSRARAGADRAGWSQLMPVQARGIPRLLKGRTVMIQARTGSGKTGAFLLPMLERLDPSRAKCQALVLVPTRELARQVWQEAERICVPAGFRTVALYGGVGYGPQLDSLRNGAHIVVGTPGRTLDHLLRRTLSLERLDMLVFDEADRMLSMGFYPDMRAIQSYLPSRLQSSSMFSATYPVSVIQTAREFMKDPEFLNLSTDQVHNTTTEHIFYVVPAMDKDRALVRIIEVENPATAIIFCNTKANVHYLCEVVQRFGYDVDELSADLTQANRERVLKRVREGTLRFLVATDVAARGLDIPELSHVIQYETPEDPESYIHRAGRTGRAGGVGTAITLVTKVENLNLSKIAKNYQIDMQERTLPTDADVAEVVAERVTVLLEGRLRDRDKLQIERSERFIPLGQSLAESRDESSIIAMLLDDFYHQTLHAPPPKPAGTPAVEAPDVQPPPSSRRDGPPRKRRRRGQQGSGGRSSSRNRSGSNSR